MIRYFTLSSLLCLLIACEPTAKEPDTAAQVPVPEAIAFNGDSLYRLEESPVSVRVKDSLLQIAKGNFDQDNNNLDNIIWLGRRTAYLNRFREAIDIFSEGLKKFPESPELYRHRGHRYITIRELDRAIADFTRAADLIRDRKTPVIEPDGIPNKLNIPLSSLQFNIWYHFGLAYYLKGDFAEAARCYEKCMEFSINDDLKCATVDWLYMTYRRMGDETAANKTLEAISENMEIIENDGYFERLLLYKGLRQPGDLLDLDSPSEDQKLKLVTQGYGVGNWYLYNGDPQKASEVFQKVIATGYWPAFGYIAAEAELARE